MHSTDDLSYRTGLLIARATVEGVEPGSRRVSAAEVKPVYDDGPLKGFTILPDDDEALREDDGA